MAFGSFESTAFHAEKINYCPFCGIKAQPASMENPVTGYYYCKSCNKYFTASREIEFDWKYMVQKLEVLRKNIEMIYKTNHKEDEE